MDAWKAGRGRQRGGGLRPVDPAKVLTAYELADLLGLTGRESPQHYLIVLFLADTGCRIGEAFALRWADVDLAQGVARISASIDFRGERVPTKTRRSRAVELSTRLREELIGMRPDVFGDDTLVFPSSSGEGAHAVEAEKNAASVRGSARATNPCIVRGVVPREPGPWRSWP